MSFVRQPLGLKQPKPSAAEGKRHMARVAELPCVCCGARPGCVANVVEIAEQRAPGM